MAIVDSILFKRALKQFFECDDLEGKKGMVLVDKLREMSKAHPERLIPVIPEAAGMHRALLEEICVEGMKEDTEQLFLDQLDDEATKIRAAAAKILSKSKQVSPTKLFRKLHEPGNSATEVIDILSAQMEFLKPEQIVNSALKLNKVHAARLFKIAEGSGQPLDLDKLPIEPTRIESPSIKILLLGYLSTQDQPAVAALVCKFLKDDNKAVTMEAMKVLRNYQCKFDITDFFPQLERMPELEREIALSIVARQTNDSNAHQLGPWVCSKSVCAKAQARFWF